MGIATFMDSHKLATAAITGIAGAIVGWAANSLTINGRVAALEASVARVEAMVTTILTSNTIVIRKDTQPGTKP